jgi:heme exporter protein C
MGAHLYYSLYAIELPTAGASAEFEYERLNGAELTSMTSAQIEQNLTLPPNGAAAYARFTNLTVPPPRIMHQAGEAIEVPYVTTARLRINSTSTVDFQLRLRGEVVFAGAGSGEIGLPVVARPRFADFPEMELLVRNLGNLSRVDVSIFVTYEDSRFFAPNAMRILLIHAPSAWVGYLGFGVALGGSLLALRSKKWEAWAVAGLELSIVFSAIALVTGPLWASAEWLTPWRWEDVKLFVTLVMFLSLLGFLSIRAGVDDPAQRRRVSAYYAVLTFITVPLSFVANRLWPRDHPAVIENPGGEISDELLSQLIFGFFILTVLFALLLLSRVDLFLRREAVEDFKSRMEEDDERLVADLPVADDEEVEEEGAKARAGGKGGKG